MMAKPHWYLVMAKPKQDEVAESQLAQQGYCVYRPEVILQKQRRGKMVALVESLFPRYLFVKLIEGVDSWGTIRSTKGVQ
ncbi:MAG: transcription/translation regulatory transformer protein RfaH, partial [Piscirickettsiaceae bacterium CG12_big_fil_rev_8_21_14_0_65_44_934]